MADTAVKAINLYPQLADIASGYVFNISSSLLENKAKIYVIIKSTCAGIPKDKAVGMYATAFVKRYNKVTNCYQWGVQLL